MSSRGVEGCISDSSIASFGFRDTKLQFRLRDGAVDVAFRPQLTADHYTEFLHRVENAATKKELRCGMREATEPWGNNPEIDTVMAGS